MSISKYVLRLATVALAMVGSLQVGFSQQNKEVEPRYTYHENDGVVIFYETDKREAYRSLLPRKFDMPDRLFVQAFVADFYKMDARTKPYKEGAIFLLAKYQGKEAWHCIAMPVTSNESRLGGILRLGLPKTMGKVELSRKDSTFSGSATLENGHNMTLNLETKGYTIGKEEEQLLRELTLIPKLNILRGEVIHMARSGVVGPGGARSIIDTARMFPRRMTLKFGKGELLFGQKGVTPGRKGGSSKGAYPFADLRPQRF